MSIFDAFTGAPAKRAAEQTRTFLDNTRTQGNADIQSGYDTATGAVRQGTAGARGALSGSYNDALGFANQGTGGALGYIDQGTQGALGRLDSSYAPLSALGNKYGAGTSLYLDALGVNGADGNQRATSAFQPTQAYNFNLDQGLEAINRARNARGMANSGNTDRDAQEYGAGLASREYGSWMDRLGGLVSPELQATSGAAAGLGSGAGIISAGGTAKAGIEGNRGSMLSALAERYGQNQAGLETGQGNTLAGLATGAANSRVGLAQGLAGNYANTYGQEAAAQQQGSGNLWNLGLNALALGTGQYGRAAGGNSTPQTGKSPPFSLFSFGA